MAKKQKEHGPQQRDPKGRFASKGSFAGRAVRKAGRVALGMAIGAAASKALEYGARKLRN